MTALLLATTGGLLLSLAFPPIGFDFLVWVAFIPLFWSLRLASRPNMAFFCGAIFGFGFFLVDLSWIYDTLIIHGHFSRIMAIAVFLAMITIPLDIPGDFCLSCALFSEQWNRPGCYVLHFCGSFRNTEVNTVHRISVGSGRLFSGKPFDAGPSGGRDRCLRNFIFDLVGKRDSMGIDSRPILSKPHWTSLDHHPPLPSREGAPNPSPLAGEGGERGNMWRPVKHGFHGLATWNGRLPWKLIAASVLAFVLILSYGQIRIKQFSFDLITKPVAAQLGSCKVTYLRK